MLSSRQHVNLGSSCAGCQLRSCALLDPVGAREAGPTEAPSVSVPAEGLGRPSQWVLCPSAQVRRLTEARSAHPAPFSDSYQEMALPCLWLLRTPLTKLNQCLKTSGKILLPLGIFFNGRLLLNPSHLTSPGSLRWACANCGHHSPKWLCVTGLQIYVEG